MHLSGRADERRGDRRDDAPANSRGVMEVILSYTNLRYNENDGLAHRVVAIVARNHVDEESD